MPNLSQRLKKLGKSFELVNPNLFELADKLKEDCDKFYEAQLKCFDDLGIDLNPFLKKELIVYIYSSRSTKELIRNAAEFYSQHFPQMCGTLLESIIKNHDEFKKIFEDS